jgi:Ca-activated chloride channel family protein
LAVGTLATMKTTWRVAAVVGFLLGSAVATAQDPAPAQSAPQSTAPPAAGPATPQPQPTFRGGVDLVTVRAIVRDGRGRTVTELEQSDFELLDRGESRPIVNFDRDPGPVGVALLFDVSGSMDVGPKIERARDAAFFLLGSLQTGIDEAAIYAFDSTLHVVQPFTTNLDQLKGRLSMVTPWGVTSLHDAIAAAAESMGSKGTRRRALVVLTDGVDTSSRMRPAEVARIASAIDVPVYVVAIVSPIDLQNTDGDRETREDAPREGTLSDLARWTGGQLFSNTAPAQSSAIARRIVEELRHQYLIGFEPSGAQGWHPLELKVRYKDHTVQARSGYVAGQSRPVSE